MKKMMKKVLSVLLVVVIVLTAAPLSGFVGLELPEWINFAVMSKANETEKYLFNGHQYQVFNLDLTWTEAKEYCEKLGGHLATITSKDENDFILSLLNGKYFFIGASDVEKEGDWKWVTGENWNYTNWDNIGYQEPNNSYGGTQHYLAIYADISSSDNAFGSWDDGRNDEGADGFICEWDSDTFFIYNGHQYQVFDLGLTWKEAKKYCENIGGHLATITSANEQNHINSLCNLSSLKYLWIGGHRDENGEFIWITGEKFEYTNWENGEPNNLQGKENELMIYTKQASNYPLGSWNDSYYSGSTGDFAIGYYGFICEWENVGIQTSVYNSNTNDIVVTPLNAFGSYSSNLINSNSGGGFYHLNDVNLKSNSTNMRNDGHDSFIIPYEDTAEKITLSKSEYHDYIIPSEVVSSWKSVKVENVKNSRPSYKHSAIMEKDKKNGKPYISTVFAREGINEYINVRTSSLQINKDCNYDIIISAGNINGKSCTYFIEQDANHSIPSETGYFSSEDLFNKLEYGKKCYAYVKTSDGIYSDLVEISLNRTESDNNAVGNFFSMSTMNLLGGDFAKFTIPGSVPVVGNAEISLEAFKLPAGVEIDGDSVKISIGANIFNYGTELKKNSPSKYKKWSSECFKDWKDLVKGKTVSNAVSDTMQKHKEAKEDYNNAKNNFASKWGGACKPEKEKNWDIEALGYVDATYVNGTFVVKEASLSIGGQFSFEYTQQGAIWIIPAYVYAGLSAYFGGATTGTRVVANSSVPFEWEWTLKFEPGLTLGAGAGVKDFASLGIYANATAPVVFNFTNQHLKWDLKGEIGVEGQFCILKAKKKILDGTTNLIDKYWGPSTNMNNMYGPPNNASYETEISIVERDYLKNTSDWLGNGMLHFYGVAQNGLTLTNLQTSVYNEAAPQVVSFGDKMLMTWVEDDDTRDTYNRMRLMYSIYSDGFWSEPLPVCDDGRNDMLPVIETDGTDVYFAWQKIQKIIAEETATIDVMTKTCEIYVAKYDSSTNSIVDTKRVSANTCYDYAHDIAINNNEVTCYWVTCADNNISSGSKNKINCYKFGGEATTLATNLNYILSLDGEYINGTEYITYSMDNDGDTLTTNDISVYTISNGLSTEIDFGENKSVYSKVLYGEFEHEQTIFVSDMSNIYYIHNDEIMSVFDTNTTISGNINYIVKDNKPYFFWTEKEEIGNAVYSSCYEDGVWTTPIKVSDTGTQLSSVDIIVYKDEFQGVCTSNELAYNETSSMYEYVQTNLCSFKIDEIQDISIDGIYIDEENIKIGETTEFDVYVTNNGTETINEISFEITDTFGYSTTVTKNVNLVSGAGDFVKLSYTAPYNYSMTTLSVTASSDEIIDNDVENNTATAVIGVSKLVLTESEIHKENGQYLITAMLTNESDVTVNNVVINAYKDEDENIVGTVVVDTIGPRETVLIDFVVDNGLLINDEETHITKVFFKAENEDKSAESNLTCFVINNINDTFDIHPSLANAIFVDEMISDLPEIITVDDIERVNFVKAEYDKLSDFEKSQLQNEEILIKAIERVSVFELDSEIINVSTMEGDATERINQLMDRYNELSDENKVLVTQYTLLNELYNALPAATYFEKGKGVDINPYVITTAEQLNVIRDYPLLHYILGNDIDLQNSDYSDWEPIPNFDGSLDGDGYCVKNFSSTKGGFIYYLTGILKNISFENVNINYCASGSVPPYSYVQSIGTLANEMTASAQIVNCSANGSLFAELVTNIGGLVGNNNSGAVKNSYAEISITSVKSDVTTSYQNIGGLIGYVTFPTSVTALIENCYSAGRITSNSNNAKVGGLIGYAKTNSNAQTSNIANSFAMVDFEYSGTVGGFIGNSLNNNLKSVNCYYLSVDEIPSCGGSSIDVADAKLREEFNNGAVTYALNSNVSEIIYYQSIEEDEHPVLDAGHKQVYYGYLNCGNEVPIYSNEITNETRPAHNIIDEECTVCGLLHGVNDHISDEWQTTVTPTCVSEGEKVKICTICNEVYITETIPAVGHRYGSVVTNPTCTENGYTTYTCSACGDSYVADETLALGHTEAEVVKENLIKETCLEDGSYDSVVYCSTCSAELKRIAVVIPSLGGHTEGDWEIAQEPTCLTVGKKVKKCTICDEMLVTEDIPAKGHTEVEWRVGIKPTCTKTGLQSKFCLICNAVLETETLPATGHTAGEWQITISPTCTAVGKQVKECTVCGSIFETQEIAMTEHIAGEWEVTVEPTCTLVGEKVKECINCQAVVETVEIPATGIHTIGDWEIIIEPTTESVGESAKKCTVCGNVLESKEVPMLTETSGFCGNDLLWNYDTETKTLTITGTGSMYDYTATNRPWEAFEDDMTTVVLGDEVTYIGRLAFYHCSNLTSVNMGSVETIGQAAFQLCTSLTTVEIGNKVTTLNLNVFNGCSSLQSVIVPATVTKISNGAFNKCTDLTNVYYEGCIDDWSLISIGTLNTYLMDATIHYHYGKPHSYNEWNVTVEPTCTETGSRTRLCLECNVTETEELTALGHKESDWIVTTVETCGTDGERIKQCMVCDTLLEKEVILATQMHVVSDWQIIIEPTTDSAGESAKKCTVCGNVLESKEVPMLTETSGFCGNDLLWNYDTETKTLTITGTGAMFDYTATTRPWEAFEDEMTTVILGDEVTYIGRLAFYHSSTLTTIDMGGVNTIGTNAFSHCTGLKNVEIGKNVTTINLGAFNGCTALESVIIPESVTTIGNTVFNNCKSLTDVYYKSSEDEWNLISIGINNTYLTSATIHFCFENYVVFIDEDMHVEGIIYELNSVLDFKNRINKSDIYVKVSDINGIPLNEADLVGTGATVYIYNSSTNELLDTYLVVLYGDVNGDGLINDTDKEIITSVATCTGTIENKWCLMAADTNHDGAVDGFDVIETEMQTLDMHNIEQVNNSAYISKEEEDTEESAA